MKSSKMKIIFVLVVALKAVSLEDAQYYPEIFNREEENAYVLWSTNGEIQGEFNLLWDNAGGGDALKRNFKNAYTQALQAYHDFLDNKRSFWERLNKWSAYADSQLKALKVNDQKIEDDVEPVSDNSELQRKFLEEHKHLNFSYNLVKPTPFVLKNTVIPRKVDWRLRNVFAWPNDYHPKCNASYAFAVAATISAHSRYYTSDDLLISNQQYLDCIFKNDIKFEKYDPCHDDKYGFNGPADAVVRAYKFSVLNGLMSKQNYPDTYGVPQTCLFEREKIHHKVKGFVILPKGENQEIALMVAVAHYGPVTVSIGFNFEPSFLRYGGGIYDLPCSKGKTLTMIVVGYGEEKGKPYWLVQNNWGFWGQYGMIKIARHSINGCDLTQQAIFPIIEGQLKPTSEYEEPNFWPDYEARVKGAVDQKYDNDKLELVLPDWPSIWGTDPAFGKKENDKANKL